MNSNKLCLSPLKKSKPLRFGMSLLEFVLAMSVSSLLLVGLHASIYIATKGLPSAQGEVSTTLQANQIMDVLATELETAIFVFERTATVIGFTMPDRDGDGLAERVRYAWTGTPGGPLTRQYNGGTPVTQAQNVDLFSLTPTSKIVAESYPGTGVEDVSESLLIDCYGTSGTSNYDVTASNWIGQYFTMTLPADTYAWRPTSVKVMAKKNTNGGNTRVQMRSPTVTLGPAATILEQYQLIDSAMTTSYAWQTFNFSTLSPLPSGGAICLVLQHQAASSSATFQGTSAYPGLQKTNDTGATWSYDSGKCLVSQLYGKLLRSQGTQSINYNYLTSMNIVMRLTPTAPTVNVSVPVLNHPELLSGKWEAKFDQNPTTLDVNGDGVGDWLVNGGGAFNTGSLVSGVWKTSGAQLNTTPDRDFSKTTVVDLKFQNTSVGGNGATFTLNALRSGSSCAPIIVALAKKADGTQTLKLSNKSSDVQTQTRMTITGLPNAPVSLRLIINPITSSASLRVNDVERGTFALTPFGSTDATRYAAIGTNGSNSEFSYARIRILEQ